MSQCIVTEHEWRDLKVSKHVYSLIDKKYKNMVKSVCTQDCIHLMCIVY